MVRLGVPARQARDRLLVAAVDHALRDGIADLSLRQLAAAIGTSHRMLIYHFGSREGLLVAVTRAVEERELEMLLGAGMQVTDPRQEWNRLSSPDLWPQERLFFELYSHALRGRPGTEGFLTRSSSRGSGPWPTPWSRRAPNRAWPGPTPGSAWPSSGTCSSTCWPPANAARSTRRSSATCN